MGNGKDLLKEYNLGDVRKRMMQLSEYSFKTGIVEDDEDNQQQQQPMQNGGQQMPMNGQQQGGGMPQQDPQIGGQQPMGQGQMDMNQGGMPQGDMNDGQMPMDNSQMDSQPVDTGEMPPMDMAQGEEEQAPDGDMPEEEMGADGEEEEEVIDVDDLTNAQEATDYKLDGVNDKITALLQVTSKFADALEDNEKQLQDLRKELERRNPTPEEKMNIRSQASYPYGESPRDYWDRKSAQNPNYEVIYNNDVAPQDEDKEFEIKRDDLEGLDDKSLSDSLEFPKELRDYLDF